MRSIARTPISGLSRGFLSFADPQSDPVVEARSNSKLEGEYLSALKRSLGEVPEPPRPLPSRRPADRERQVLFDAITMAREDRAISR